MKTTQNLLVCVLFTCLLSASAVAGDMHNPGRMAVHPTISPSDSHPKAKGNSSREGGNTRDLLIHVVLFFHKSIATAL